MNNGFVGQAPLDCQGRTETIMHVTKIGDAMFAAAEEAAPMSEDMTRMFVLMSMMESTLDVEPLPSDITESFKFQVIKKRLEVTYGKPIATDSVIGTLAYQSDRVGVAVLYAAAIAAIYLKVKHVVTMDDLVEYFPMGFPVEEELHKIWIAQKLSGDMNSVDMKAAWEDFSGV